MSEKKPGFFKRLLGSLMGAQEETPPAPAQTPPPPPPPSGAATPKRKTPAKPKAPAKAKAPAAKKPAADTAAKKPAAAKTARAPSAVAGPEPAAKPKAAKPSARPAAGAKPAKARTAPKPTRESKPGPKPGSRPVKPSPVRKAEARPAPPKPRETPRPAPIAAPERKGWFTRLRDGLSKTSDALTGNIATIFTKRRLDEETLQELEDALIQADLGADMAVQITEALAKGRYDKEIAPEEVRAVLGAEVAGVLEPVAAPLTLDAGRKPHVILVVGVNGTGKTTTIGKLSNRFANEGRKVMLAAGDTFRAAAIEQLQIWGERTGAPVVARAVGADAAGLAYDALQKAREDEADILLIDTAGRLQNKKDLMDELAKIVRVIKKLDETAPHSVLLVLDATTGQNAMRQVEVFQEIAGVTGLIMNKLDGTARGGILVAIARRFALPVHAIGVGESIDDLQPFDAFEFASAIAGAREKVGTGIETGTETGT